MQIIDVAELDKLSVCVSVGQYDERVALRDAQIVDQINVN